MSYSTVQTPSLLYATNPKILDSVTERRTVRYFPQQRQGLRANDSIYFDFACDSMLDLASATLNFKLDLFTDAAGTVAPVYAAPATSVAISSASDVVNRMEILYNDQQVETILDANAWCNVFMKANASKTWANGDASVLLGLTDQLTDNNAPLPVSKTNTSRNYSVPLAFLSGFFRCNSISRCLVIV